VEITGDNSALLEKRPAGQLSIVDYSLDLRGAAGAKAWTSLCFYDNRDSLLLEYTAPCTIKGPSTHTGNYTEAPPNTAYLTVSMGADKGCVPQAANYQLHVQKDPAWPTHAPGCDLARYMRPFWQSDTIFNETVLLLSEKGAPASGRLLYSPDKILSVRNFSLDTVFREGIDYELKGRMLTRPASSSVRYRTDNSFDTKDLAWYDLQSQWVTVTYTHHDKWEGPVPGFKGNSLPLTLEKLRAGSPVTIVSYGMSITRGMDVSGFDSVPPYMPTYMELFVWSLRESYHNKDVRLFNAGLPGAAVDWGAAYTDNYVTPLHPDLAVIDFGMNDFWRMPPAAFRDSIQTIIRKVRNTHPNTEFLLLANMPFDPGYVVDSDKNKAFYTGNLAGYRKVLQEMEGPGVACVDMYSIGEAVYRRKKAKDCIVNPLHPNDYLARWYAQALANALIQ
jgi:lysophospholipase L1-like esterase